MKQSDKYPISVHYSPEEGEFIALCSQFPRLSGFGETRGEAISILQDAIEMGLEMLKESNQKIPEPDELSEYSGKINLRLPKSLHQSLALEAEKEGISLNQLMVHKLSSARNTSEANLMEKVLDQLKLLSSEHDNHRETHHKQNMQSAKNTVMLTTIAKTLAPNQLKYPIEKISIEGEDKYVTAE